MNLLSHSQSNRMKTTKLVRTTSRQPNTKGKVVFRKEEEKAQEDKAPQRSLGNQVDKARKNLYQEGKFLWI